MKKIFSFLAVILMAMAVNAEVIQITPTSPHSSNNLRQAIAAAATGDIVEMAAGTYEESGDYLAFTGKEVIVRAAEGAEVIIKPVCPVRLKSGAKAEFINVKFDCSTVGSYDYVIVPADDTDNKRVVLTGCEFYGWDKNKAMIEATSSRRLDAITIENCYFHNCMKSVVFVENTGSIDLSITNTTFANISTDASAFYAGVIDSRATSGSFLVDHCTFYNVQVMNTDYAAVGKVKLTSGAVVSNCIFAMPESTSGVRTIRDAVAANNCMVFNYASDSNLGMQSAVTKTNCVVADPLFVDADNGDYTLGEESPALGAGTDESNLGDPRWWPADETPEPAKEYVGVYNWSTGDDAIGVTALGATGVDISTVKIHNNTDSKDAIKFSSSYAYAGGKYLVIKPEEGKFLEGDEVYFSAVISNDATDGSKYAQVDIYAADGSTRLFRSDTVVNGKMSSDEPVIENFVLSAEQDSILVGRYGNTNMFVLSLTVVRPVSETPEPEHIYSVAGSEALLGTNWNEAEGNEMVKQDDGTYQLVLSDVELVVGNYEYKVVIDHILNNGEAESNSVLEITTAGRYNVTFTYDPSVPTTSAEAELIEEIIVLPTAIDNAGAAVKAQKVVIDGQLLIIRGGKIFNAQGQLQ